MRLGIRATLIFGLAGLLLAALAVAGAVALQVSHADAESQAVWQFDRRADGLVALVNAQARRPEGLAELDRQLRSAASGADLAAAGVFDGALRPVAGAPAARHLGLGDALGGSASGVALDRADDDRRGAGRDYRVARPVRLLGGQPGALALIFDLDPARAAAASGQSAVLWSLAGDFVLVLLFGLYLATRLLVRPVRALTAAAEAIAARDLGPEAVPRLRGPREIGILAERFRTMVARLRERQATLERTILDLERTRGELVQSEKLATVGQLAAGVAHEVGNPLTAVMGYVELLREAEVPAALQADLLARTDRELRRMGQTIRSLLDFSRAEPVVPAATGLAEVAAAAAALVRYHPALRTVALSVTGTAPPVWADADRLRHAVVNLLINAGQAGATRVTLTVAPGAPWRAALTVADDGPGIDPSVATRLFDPFVTTRPAGEGTGLGLAIARRVVEEAGGTLALGPGLTRSARGEGAAPSVGAAFTVELPVWTPAG